MSARIRDVLTAVPTYRPGQVVPGAVKLSSNELPFPPLPGVLEAAIAAAADMNRYPDMAAVELTCALAADLSVQPDQIAIGTGSIGVLQQLVQATAEATDEVVFPWRSFEAYPIVVEIAGATGVPVALTERCEIDLEAMARAVTPRTRLILLCTPNNPTGPALRHSDVLAFLAQVPSDVLVVIDEAYVEFVRDPAAVNGPALLADHLNVCLLRTFSKAYGLAGLRVGFAVAQPALAEAVRKCAVPFGVSTIAQQAAVESLRRREDMLARVDLVVQARQHLAAGMAEHGWSLPASEANFLWLPLGQASTEFVRYCAQAALIVRPFDGVGCRVTVGTPDDVERFLAHVTAWPVPTS